MFTKCDAYILKWAHSWIFWWQIQYSINFISHGAFDILQRSCILCTMNIGCVSLLFKIFFVLYIFLLYWDIYLDYFFQLSLEFGVAMWLSLAKGMCYMLLPVLAHTNFPYVILHGLSPSTDSIQTSMMTGSRWSRWQRQKMEGVWDPVSLLGREPPALQDHSFLTLLKWEIKFSLFWAAIHVGVYYYSRWPNLLKAVGVL